MLDDKALFHCEAGDYVHGLDQGNDACPDPQPPANINIRNEQHQLYGYADDVGPERRSRDDMSPKTVRQLTVPVKRATAPSRTSDSPHSRYSVQNTAGEDCTNGRAMAIGILARVIASGINRFILLIDDHSRSGRGNHQHSVVCAKHLVVDIDAHYGVCTQTAGTLSHFVHSLLTCLDQLALI